MLFIVRYRFWKQFESKERMDNFAGCNMPFSNEVPHWMHCPASNSLARCGRCFCNIICLLIKYDRCSYIRNFCSCEKKHWKKKFRLLWDLNVVVVVKKRKGGGGVLFLTTWRMLLNLNFQEVQQPVANMLRHSDEKKRPFLLQIAAS